ncbi:hypothetical protein [Pseudactinotalea terrae]|uniref:hypothetical protein n=1 Tax=Pseudactinotalea terrae TaxID=1743262 RepID=UPI0012E1F926|nr:hypothetical protein [Pseudactinotalea terrae]
MVNRMKDRGDRTEREALALLLETTPELLVRNAMRQLGAGRKDDIGDLHVFPDCAVQVKASVPTTVTARCREAAVSAHVQAGRALFPHHVGMVKLHNVRKGTKWLATALTWPTTIDPFEAKSAVAVAIARARDESLPLTERISRVSGRGAAPYLVGPWEAWLAAYRSVRDTEAA